MTVEELTEEERRIGDEMHNIKCMAEFFRNVEKLDGAEHKNNALRSIRGGAELNNMAGERAMKKGNFRAARRDFLKAARRDYAPAIYNYGLLYLTGCAVRENKETAAILFELAARKGEPRALAKLSQMYTEGCWVEKSLFKAYVCAEVAAEYCKEGQLQLAHCLEKGIGVTPDIHKAIVLRLMAHGELRTEGDAK